MKVKELKNDKLHRAYEVTVPAKEIEEEFERELFTFGQKVKIDGFRPGKVPPKILKEKYGETVRNEVVSKKIQLVSTKLISDKKLEPAGRPDVNIEKYEDGSDLTLKVELDILPEVKEIDYKKVELEKLEYEVEKKEIDEGLERLAAQNRNLSPKSGAAAKGDVVKIDFVGSIGGEEFAGGKAEDFQLELGSAQFIAGFEEQLEGKKAGDDVSVNVTFPKEYHAPEYAGKDAVFEVKIHEVLKAELPKIDDALAKDMGFDDLAKMTEAVKGHLQSDYDRMINDKLKLQLFDYLEENLKFDLPEKMVEAEFNAIWQQIEQAKAQGVEDFEGKSEDELKKEYQRIAKRRVLIGIYLAEIGKKNKLQASQDELRGAIMQQAQSYPQQAQQIMEYYQKNPNAVQELTGPIIEDKAVNLILEKVTFKKKKATLNDLLGNADDNKSKKKSTAKKAKK